MWKPSCSTCIGNSGPLPKPVVEAITTGDLIVSGVLSGNRNFEGRIHPYIKANYLASPPLVVAYALAGTTDIDMVNEPLGRGKDGQSVYLKDIWPTQAEVAAEYDKALNPDTFRKEYDGIEESNPKWNAIPIREGALYKWDEWSTYIQEPPFFVEMSPEPEPIQPINTARDKKLTRKASRKARTRRTAGRTPRLGPGHTAHAGLLWEQSQQGSRQG